MPINEFKGEYRWLSNFWPCNVSLYGCEYPSVEHAYQAAKTTDEEKRVQFQAPELTAKEAKKLGKRLKIRSEWNNEKFKLGIMEGLVRQKFSDLNPELKEKLLATKNEGIVEGNFWRDSFWGIDLHTGNGYNHLGKIIMKIRRELQQRK